MSPLRIICLPDFKSRTQLGLSIFILAHGSLVIGAIVFCYAGIYREYKITRKNVDKNQNSSSLMTQNLSKVEATQVDNTEFRILLTVAILAGWTSVGKPIHKL
jgi:hypothetical protein